MTFEEVKVTSFSNDCSVFEAEMTAGLSEVKAKSAEYNSRFSTKLSAFKIRPLYGSGMDGTVT